MDAQQTYTSRKRDVAALLDLISLELDEHAREAQAAGGPNWAECGDLGHMTEVLSQALAFISGVEIEDVRETLEDMRAGRSQRDVSQDGGQAARNTTD